MTTNPVPLLPHRTHLSMALRGAQGDHPAKGREAPEAKAAQATKIKDIRKPPCPQGTTPFSQKPNPNFSGNPAPASRRPLPHATRKHTMALRGAQGDRPTKGREAPEAKAAQPS